MVGRRVRCVVKSAMEKRSVQGVIVKQCDNANVFVLKLDHAVDFWSGKRYTYPKNATILVTKSEIQ